MTGRRVMTRHMYCVAIKAYANDLLKHAVMKLVVLHRSRLPCLLPCEWIARTIWSGSDILDRNLAKGASTIKVGPTQAK